MGREALIISPFIRKARITSILKLLAVPLKQGVKITMITRSPEDYKAEQQAAVSLLIETLRSEGITVITHSGVFQKYAVIDKSIVWYGSIDFLSYGNSQESIMRFENADLAGELLDAATER